MESIWSKTQDLAPHESLHGDIHTDVAIIGGGLTGLLTAYFLQSYGIDAVVLEQNRIASGQTHNTTAKITSQHGFIYHKLIEQFGLTKATQYASSNQRAIEEYAKMIEDNQISCGFERKDAFLYSKDDPEKIELEMVAAQKAGIEATFLQELPLPYATVGAVRFPNQAQFHPLQFLDAISKGLTIYENTAVTDIRKHFVLTNRGTVQADHIVIASHYPMANLHGLYFLKIFQQRSYVLALKNAASMDGMYIGEATDDFSFRNYNDLLLFGGSGHRTGTSKGENYKKLLQAAKAFYPRSEVVAKWSAQDCMTLDGVPYIGQFEKHNDTCYVATGFQKWGMSSSMVSAMILSDLIQGRNHSCAEVFSPQRFDLAASSKKGFVQTGHAIKGLTTGLFSSRARRCTHMGCRLHENKEEGTLECACHGSQFTMDGKLISNPALRSIGEKDEI